MDVVSVPVKALPEAPGSPRDSVRRLGGAVGPYAVAFAVPVLVLCAVAVVRRQFPFGPGSRSYNDLGNAYVPLHAQLHDLLHGHALGDLFMSWDAALGAPFLPDYVVNLGSPFALLVAAFPRDRMELAVFVVTIVKYGAASVAMTWYLRSTFGGSRWLAAVLGISYGLCAWGFDDASYVPMWVDGLIALPLLLRAVEWVIARRPLWQPAALVALAWAANFYTGFMASLLAGLVLLVRLATLDRSLRDAVRVVGRACVAFGCGLALAAPLLAPALLAARGAQPANTGSFDPASWSTVLARLLTGTEGVGASPSLAPGSTLVLVLACGYVAETRVAPRVRALWVGLVVSLLLSFQWAPTQAAWHGFDTPNGSRYREAWILTAVLVVLAWQTVRAGPLRPRVVMAGLAGLALCMLVANRDYVERRLAVGILVAAAAGLAALAAVQLARGRGRRVWAGVALVALVGVVAVEATAADVRMDRLRADRLGPQPRRPALTTAVTEAVRRAEQGAQGVVRVDTGPVVGSNSTMLVRALGSSYYSNVVPAPLSAFFVATGAGWSGLERALYAPPVQASDAALGIDVRITGSQPAAGPPVVTSTQRVAAPVVTFRPDGRPDPALGADPFRQQELLLGATVYERPPVTGRAPDGRALTVQPDGTFHVPGDVAAPGVVTLDTRCRPGSQVAMWAPALAGTARLGAEPAVSFLVPTSRSPGAYTGASVHELGAVGSDGAARVTVTVQRWSRIPPAALGCLDEAALRRTVETLTASSPRRFALGGHSVSATVTADRAGLMVAAVPLVPGWGCSVDGHGQTASSFHGLLAAQVPAGTHQVGCSFRPPGLNAGLLLAGVSVLVLLGAAILPRARRRAADGDAPSSAVEEPVPADSVGGVSTTG